MYLHNTKKNNQNEKKNNDRNVNKIQDTDSRSQIQKVPLLFSKKFKKNRNLHN